MYPVIPVELAPTVVQMVICFITVVGAFWGLMMSGRVY